MWDSFRGSVGISWGIMVAIMAGATGRAAASVLLVPETYPTIQAAVDAAGITDTVSIAPGVYTGEGNRDVRVIGKSLLLRSLGGPDVTVLDCQSAGQGLYLRGPATPVIEGLTITHGTADFGGAIWAHLSSPIVRQCRFVSNVGFMGGACWLGGAATFEDCEFISNEDTSQGGGAVFALSGAVVFNRCLFAGNFAAGTGGAVRTDGAAVAFTDCTITDNISNDAAGGVFSFGADVTMERTICRGNWGSGSGSEIYAFANTVTLHCCDVGLSGVVANLLVQGNVIDQDPRFCGQQMHDYTLRSDSPCLAGGNPCGVLIGAFDLGCLAPSSGACCLPDNTCIILTQDSCDGLQGRYLGDGVFCQPDPCQPTPTVPTSWGRLKARFR